MDTFQCPHCEHKAKWQSGKDRGTFKCQRMSCGGLFSFTWCTHCSSFGNAVSVRKGQSTVTCACKHHAYNAKCPKCHQWCTFTGRIDSGRTLRHRACGCRFRVVRNAAGVYVSVRRGGGLCTAATPHEEHKPGVRGPSSPHTRRPSLDTAGERRESSGGASPGSSTGRARRAGGATPANNTSDTQFDLSVRPVGEGSFRLAFSAKVRQVSPKHARRFALGDEVVFKAMKPELHNNGMRISRADIVVHQRAQALAASFMSLVHPLRAKQPLLVEFTSSMLWTLRRDYCDKRGVRLLIKGERVLVEKRLRGTFHKFNSNSGWSDKRHRILQFFSHWTYAHTNGQELLCDLQGVASTPEAGDRVSKVTGSRVCYPRWYVLTDPAIMSVSSSGKYGATDLGM